MCLTATDLNSFDTSFGLLLLYKIPNAMLEDNSETSKLSIAA